MKKKSVTKLLAAALSLVLTLGVLSGCGSTDSQKSSESKASQASSSQTSQASSAQASSASSTEVVEEIAYPEELSVYCGTFTGFPLTDYSETTSMKQIEKLTSTKVEWDHPAAGAGTEAFKMLLASGEYPDIMMRNWYSISGGPASYVEDEVIIELQDLIEECMPNFCAYVTENDLWNQLKTDDGKIYAIPFISGGAAITTWRGLQVRSDYLEAANMEIPTTVDEFYKLLVAMKKNGIKYPYAGVGFGTSYGTGSLLNLVWPFGTTSTFCLDENGKVVYGPMTENFVEAITFLNKLYEEELMSPDYLTLDLNMIRSMMVDGTIGITWLNNPTVLMQNESFNDGTRRIIPIPLLRGEEGIGYTFDTVHMDMVQHNCEVAVSAQCENPKEALKWLDTFFSEEGHLAMNYGEEGYTYTMVDGKPVYTDTYWKDPNYPDLTEAATKTIHALNNGTCWPSVQDYEAFLQRNTEWAREAFEVWASGDLDKSRMLSGSLSFTTEEEEKITQVMSQVNSYIPTQWNNVVLGELDIAEWDNVVEELKKMGIEEVIKIYQDAYDRYVNR